VLNPFVASFHLALESLECCTYEGSFCNTYLPKNKKIYSRPYIMFISRISLHMFISGNLQKLSVVVGASDQACFFDRSNQTVFALLEIFLKKLKRSKTE